MPTPSFEPCPNAQTFFGCSVLSAAHSQALPGPLPSSLRQKTPRMRGHIHSNSLRPAVRAADRLFHWQMPHGLAASLDLEGVLPAGLPDSVYMAICSYYAPNTKGTYGAGILQFTEFCDKHEISKAQRMPAPWSLLCAFISEHQGRQSGNTIKTWIASIHAWHVINCAPWHGEDDWVSMCRTAAKHDGTRFCRPLRAPISVKHLLVLWRSLDLLNSFHSAVWAMALSSFFGCHRLGEMAVPSAAKFDPKYHVLASSPVLVSHFNNATTHSASFRVPWTKTTQEEGASVILTGCSDNLCPVMALLTHQNVVNKECPPDMSFFAYRSSSGTWTHMVKKVFLDFCGSIWKAAGLKHVFGHSFWIGGTVELLLVGVNPDVVAATGGWTSLAFLLYWCRMEEIIPLSTSRAYKKAHLDELMSLFQEFQTRHKLPSASSLD